MQNLRSHYLIKKQYWTFRKIVLDPRSTCVFWSIFDSFKDSEDIYHRKHGNSTTEPTVHVEALLDSEMIPVVHWTPHSSGLTRKWTLVFTPAERPYGERQGWINRVLTALKSFARKLRSLIPLDQTCWKESVRRERARAGGGEARRFSENMFHNNDFFSRKRSSNSSRNGDNILLLSASSFKCSFISNPPSPLRRPAAVGAQKPRAGLQISAVKEPGKNFEISAPRRSRHRVSSR